MASGTTSTNISRALKSCFKTTKCSKNKKRRVHFPSGTLETAAPSEISRKRSFNRAFKRSSAQRGTKEEKQEEAISPEMQELCRLYYYMTPAEQSMTSVQSIDEGCTDGGIYSILEGIINERKALKEKLTEEMFEISQEVWKALGERMRERGQRGV
ncbi:uncharacterized protein BKA55DRAFT_695766 [Fusarium redolens]|uniref:Uncharacterized protein n=1 Tax=Fusarium redolens TaxID=48865 RepID=A0A9P9JP57_FUSRE|nr:uncharacterized protein BKA55DRAFT_695766 [Fusarium redolens]KAH7232347.1 hypothetical protein BKA55DRAFT_695766 [Fusarium redolens]